MPPGAQQVKLGIASPLDSHCQFTHWICTGLQGYAFCSELSQTLDFFHESFFVDKAKSGVTLEMPQCVVVERCLVVFGRRVWSYQITAFLEFQGSIQAINLNLATDALGTLSPFKLYALNAKLFDYILSHAKASIFDVHLHKQVTITFIPSLEYLYASLHVRGFGYLAVAIEFEGRVDTTYVFAANKRNTRYTCTRCEVIPVVLGNISRAECSGKDRHAHFDLRLCAVAGLGIYQRKQSVIRITILAFGQPLCTHSVTLDIYVGVVDWIILVTAGSQCSEWSRIQNFSTAK